MEIIVSHSIHQSNNAERPACMARMSDGQAIFGSLRAHGVGTIFGIVNLVSNIAVFPSF